MSDDLSEFLKRAAQRRQNRNTTQPASGGNPQPQPATYTPVPPPEQRILVSDRHLQSHQLETPDLGYEVDQADERADAHLKSAFHDLRNTLQPDPSTQKPSKQNQPSKQNPKSKKSQRKSTQSIESSSSPPIKPATTSVFDDPASNSMSAIDVPETDQSRLIKMLRDPVSLKSAFIVSEIFQRRFD